MTGGEICWALVLLCDIDEAVALVELLEGRGERQEVGRRNWQPRSYFIVEGKSVQRVYVKTRWSRGREGGLLVFFVCLIRRC